MKSNKMLRVVLTVISITVVSGFPAGKVLADADVFTNQGGIEIGGVDFNGHKVNGHEEQPSKPVPAEPAPQGPAAAPAAPAAAPDSLSAEGPLMPANAQGSQGEVENTQPLQGSDTAGQKEDSSGNDSGNAKAKGPAPANTPDSDGPANKDPDGDDDDYLTFIHQSGIVVFATITCAPDATKCDSSELDNSDPDWQFVSKAQARKFKLADGTIIMIRYYIKECAGGTFVNGLCSVDETVPGLGSKTAVAPQ